MDHMKRYAVYYAPEAGPFAQAAATWLGWDPATGRAVAQPDLGLDLPAMTADPRKYGFHGTIKPPFRLAQGVNAKDLGAAVGQLAKTLPTVDCVGLQMLELEGFLALVPQGSTPALGDLAAQVVAKLDHLRAPLTAAEVARRKPDQLTPRQQELLALYGYPYVMEEFRFHLTLSGHLSPADHAALLPLAVKHFMPHLPHPFRIDTLCLFGESEDGRFHLLHRYPLG